MNKETIEYTLENLEYPMQIGCWDEKLKDMSKQSLKDVLNNIKYGADSGDMEIRINRKKYILEIMVVDYEVDMYATTPAEYEEKYGRKYGE